MHRLPWKSRKGHCFFAGLFLAAVVCGYARAQAVSPEPVGAALISQPVFPLSQVHRGLQGTAYSVLEGSKPEAIDLEILGVLRDVIGPGKDMILVRLEGSKAEYNGVVAGMSGSPVYINGKLLGAIGYRIGNFTRQPIAGVTPIQQMVEVLREGATKQNAYMARPGSFDRDVPRDSDRITDADILSDPVSMEGLARRTTMLQPIETPLSFNGFSSAAIDIFQQRIPWPGMTPVSGLGGSSPEKVDPAPIVPGSAISAVIVSGDFNIAATCTVTYVDPKHVLACGHPITRFGDISLPMTKAEVVTTIASPLDPMKVVNTTQTVGSFTQDRESGILGVFGKPARMIPVTLAMGGNTRPHTYHFDVAEHPRLTSAALMATIYQAMQDTNSYSDPSTYDLRGEISLEGYPAVHIDSWIAPTSGQPSSLAAAMAISQRFNSIFSNPRELPIIRSIHLSVVATPGEHSASLADARVLSPTVRAGSRVTVEAVLHPYRQSPRVVRLDVRLPLTLEPGPVRLLVSDGTTLDHTLQLIPNPSAPPADLAETISRLNQLHATDRVYVTLLAPVAQARLQGHDLPAVPLTMANVLQPEQKTQGFSIHGETAIALGSKRLDLALSGSQVIALEIKP